MLAIITKQHLFWDWQVSVIEDGGDSADGEDAGGNVEGGGGGNDDDNDPDEYVHVDEQFYYLEYIIRALGITHAVVSLCMVIAYYNLKVLHRADKKLIVRLGQLHHSGQKLAFFLHTFFKKLSFWDETSYWPETNFKWS